MPKLEMTSDEIVHAIVQMYSVNAAVNISDFSFRDSISGVYLQQISKLTGHSIETIKSDFAKLQQMPDSLLVLQNRSLDTIRVIQERLLTRGSTSKFNIN
ncbi:MAG: hypothetical protein IPN46_07305 [Saprospiraceae bacterium]|nr:hypothetical protein [Saprospiraceae bacterium]